MPGWEFLKTCFSEVQFVANLLGDFPVEELDSNGPWKRLDDACLVKAIRQNKVAVKFGKKIEKNRTFQESFFAAFPGARGLFDELNAKIESDSNAFAQIKERFSEENIEFMLIKSDGSFPYESDNIDVLIKPEKLQDVHHLLDNAGYSEMTRIREPHKFLFRKMQTFEELPIHIHTRVEWEGTQFVDSDELWSRTRTSDDSGGFSMPSPEDCVLITAAHFFFENHEIKLADLLKLNSCIRNNNLDWHYAIDHAKKLHWNDAFALSLLLTDQVFKDLYGRNLLPDNVINEMKQISHGHVALFQKFLPSNGSTCVPFNIPYSFGALFIVQRIVQESSIPLAGRLNHIAWIASDIVRRRIR